MGKKLMATVGQQYWTRKNEWS